MSRMRNPNLTDTVTKASIETISATGYRVDIAADGHGTYAVTASGLWYAVRTSTSWWSSWRSRSESTLRMADEQTQVSYRRFAV